MFKTISAARKTKEKLTINVLNMLDGIEVERNKNEALSHLKNFSKFNNVGLKQMFPRKPLKESLYKFILNKEGYNETIVQLYNSLLNSANEVHGK